MLQFKNIIINDKRRRKNGKSNISNVAAGIEKSFWRWNKVQQACWTKWRNNNRLFII